ncbi:MAG: hypothetical protein HQ500_02315 [Flavobacteriales bacterium]|nr:hypothetical protein [Flavobacteriales bacterium]
MRNDYSLETLSDFVREEASELESIGLKAQQEGPSELTLQKILGFSKQLSVRPSSTLGQYEQNLN